MTIYHFLHLCLSKRLHYLTCVCRVTEQANQTVGCIQSGCIAHGVSLRSVFCFTTVQTHVFVYSCVCVHSVALDHTLISFSCCCYGQLSQTSKCCNFLICSRATDVAWTSTGQHANYLETCLTTCMLKMDYIDFPICLIPCFLTHHLAVLSPDWSQRVHN